MQRDRYGGAELGLISDGKASGDLVEATSYGSQSWGSWHLDGSLKQIPCGYDFNGLIREEESLPEVMVGRWGRFIFINADPSAESLESFLGDLGSHFELLPYEKRYKSAHVAKVIRANWKVVQEAFMESYHVLMTHPQILTGGAHDICTKYDAFGNYSRAIRCGALEGDGLPPWDPLPGDKGMEIVRHPLNGDVYEHLGDGVVKVTTKAGRPASLLSKQSGLKAN